MRYLGWKTEITRLALLVGAAALLGSAMGLGPWLVVIATSGYALWSLYHLHQLNHWLLHGQEQEPPEATGLWGQVLDLIFQIQREDREVKARLQAMVDYLRSSFASMSDATVMLDPAGNIEWCNRAAGTLLGLRQSDDSGRLLVNLLRSPEFIRYFDAEKYDEPLEMVSPVNQQIRLLVSITFFGRRSRLLFARDVTRTHRLEQMRRDFVANVSHELRTPLTVIGGYLDTFAGQVAENPRWQRAIEQMQQQSRRMQNLVSDLMALSRLESLPSPRERERIALRPLMEMIREEALIAADGERDFQLECDDSLAVLGHEGELRSAFSNLAVNAAKYTRPGDSIWMRWYADRDHAYFEVSDSGQGIEPRHIPRLTERFYRVDPSRSSATGGTGLGLAIVKHVLLRHQAELRVHSEPGKGSTFTCVFPLAATERLAS